MDMRIIAGSGLAAALVVVGVIALRSSDESPPVRVGPGAARYLVTGTAPVLPGGTLTAIADLPAGSRVATSAELAGPALGSFTIGSVASQDEDVKRNGAPARRMMRVRITATNTSNQPHNFSAWVEFESPP